MKIYTDGSTTRTCYVFENGLKAIKPLTRRATVNEAEYLAVIHALREATNRGIKQVDIYSDSELIVRQLNGAYAVKKPELVSLWNKVWELIALGNLTATFTWVSREQNLAGRILG